MNSRELAEAGWPCPTGAEMGQIDRDAIECRGLPGRVLMENAGRAIAEAVRRLAPESRRPLVVCGGGNNGGDGFVVARVLREWDDRIAPIVLALGDHARRSPEAQANFELLMTSGVDVELADAHKDIDALVAGADLLIDALFGVGLARPVEGPAAELLRALSAVKLPLVAIDLPSGLSSESGRFLGPVQSADFIVTLALPKLGLAVQPQAGEIWVADIGLPAASLEAVPIRQRVWTRSAARARLPERPLDAHKGTFGHVLVAGGSAGKTGAAVLAAEGAVGAGAGLVTVAHPESLGQIFEIKLTEAMTLAYPDGGHACLGAQAVPALLAELETRDVLVTGPGVGTAADTQAALASLLQAAVAPAVVDADGLNAFAGRPEQLRSEAVRVLTPHPGEMARLLSSATPEVQADRIGAARELARRSDAVAVLKGARTVIAEPGGEVLVNPTGGPGLATGGTGDVLAGAIGAFLAQGLEPFGAAGLGAYVHGLAGERGGLVGTAGSVAASLPAVLAELRSATIESDGPGTLRRFP